MMPEQFGMERAEVGDAKPEKDSAMTTTRRQEQENRAKAFHEAGHVIIARLLGWNITKVVLKEERGDRSNTTYETEKWEREDGIRFSLAGEIAQRRHDPKSLHRFCTYDIADDQNNAVVACQYATRKKDVLHIQPDHRKANAMLNRLIQETEKLVEQHWAQVEAVAEALLAKGELSPTDIDEAMGRKP